MPNFYCSSDKLVNPSEIKTNPDNPNEHPQAQIDMVIELIEFYGWRHSLIVSNQSGLLVVGEGRLKAAIKRGWENVPVQYQDFEDYDQEYGFVCSDNALQGWSQVNLAKVNLMIPKLSLPKIELLGIKGFKVDPSEKDIEKADNVPKTLQNEMGVKPGDLYQLGGHKLLCGDCTVKDNVDALMRGKKADMVFTDPPYGVDFQQGKFIGREKQGKNRQFNPMVNDDLKGGKLSAFLSIAFGLIPKKEGTVIYSWSPPLVEGFSILEALIESGWHIQSQIIWNKSPFVIGRADYHWKHEVCWYGYHGKNHVWLGGRDKGTVWDVPKTSSSNLHPTMKPVQLAEIAIENSGAADGIIYDPFTGSGSTLIGCEKTNRKCYGMEIDPHYCSVTIKRWQEFTGKKAEKIGSH